MTDFATRRNVMVDTQVRPSDVTKFPIIDAMLTVPREEFVPNAQREAAYCGENLVLDANRVVLDPRSFAKMLDTLVVAPDELVLDVGAGLGYAAAVLARLAEAVVALECDPQMAQDAQEALSAAGADNVVVETGELTVGAAEHAPFDVIIIEGGVQQIPDALVNQLKEGGRMAAIFMNGALGEMRVGRKIKGQMQWRLAFSAGAPVLPGFEAEEGFTL